VFEAQALHCEPRSPLYARLLRAWADDEQVASIVGESPHWDAPLRLLGGMHYLVLGGEASWDDSPGDHLEFLSWFVHTQGVQTNEVQRSWVLGPLFCRVAQRTGAREIDVVELGPSAGLNLAWDRYRCEYEAGSFWGYRSPLVLRGRERRPVHASLLRCVPRVRSRLGIDKAPIDVTDPASARLLKSFVWADQVERLERMEAAIDMVSADPPELLRADFVEALPGVLAKQPGDVPTVVFQTAALGYVGESSRDRVRRALDDAGVELPLAFISAGNPRVGEQEWGLRIVYWPGGGREFVGHADYHGRWLDLEV
jgi:hypothetical protein